MTTPDAARREVVAFLQRECEIAGIDYLTVTVEEVERHVALLQAARDEGYKMGVNDALDAVKRQHLASTNTTDYIRYALLPATPDAGGGEKARERPAARSDAYCAIDSEREYQDRKWGGPSHDETHSAGDFVAYIQRAARKALDHDSKGDEDAVLHEVRQIAALAVACMESQGVRYREAKQEAAKPGACPTPRDDAPPATACDMASGPDSTVFTVRCPACGEQIVHRCERKEPK